MNPITILGQIFKIAKTIKETVDNVKDNQAQCKRLAERIDAITRILQSRNDRNLPMPEFTKSLENFCSCVEQCLDFVTHFKNGTPGWKQFFKHRGYKEQFAEMNLQLSQYANDLTLGINLAQLFDRKLDENDQKMDLENIVSKVDEILTKMKEMKEEQIRHLQMIDDSMEQRFNSLKGHLQENTMKIRDPVRAREIDDEQHASLQIQYDDLTQKECIGHGISNDLSRGKRFSQDYEIKTAAAITEKFETNTRKIPSPQDYRRSYGSPKSNEQENTTVNIPVNAKWAQQGVTVAGGHRLGSDTNQLNRPRGLFVDDDQTVVVADYYNDRIIQWKKGDTTNGQVVAGGNSKGSGLNQLNGPADVLIDKEMDSLIICDWRNRRVVRWSRRNGTTQGEVLVDNIRCWGLAMDDQRYLYVSDYEKHEVRRYQLDGKNGTLVAGGNGKGDRLNQLNDPYYLFVDQQQTVYVSDYNNHRVMKWTKGAKEGIVVAGGQGSKSDPKELLYPQGLFVDTLGTLYVSDFDNHRVMRWTQGAYQGTKIVGGNGRGIEAKQLEYPRGLSFDRLGNLYVVDCFNHRVQRFSIE
ncbi:unnamed protein product [Rotaria magnacalcarata]|nr:unnamed protein product [Rotaria magnacalcarata]CAF1316907.1 unnamed protein product [Rotaria magnacalcarata]